MDTALGGLFKMPQEIRRELWGQARTLYKNLENELGRAPKEYIIQIVKSLRTQGLNDTQISNILGVYRNTFNNWIRE